jgi:hypothetical protein
MDDTINIAFKLAGFYQVKFPLGIYHVIIQLQDPYNQSITPEWIKVFRGSADVTDKFFEGKTSIRATASNLRIILNRIRKKEVTNER